MKQYILRPEKRQFAIDYENDLNPEQLEAVLCPGGPVLVLAGAGSGKTRTVTYRVARLIETGINPQRILLMTFTNKASREMLIRVESLLQYDIKGLWGGTFHHIGNMVLRRHAEEIGYKSGFSILDREDSKDLIETCAGELGLDKAQWRFPKGDVLQEIAGLSSNTEEAISDVVIKRFPHFLSIVDEIEGVLKRYKGKKEALNLMDFDDLLMNWKRLLEEKQDIREIYSERFLHILVDEYQDTNKIQADIIDLLTARHRNIYVVGDDAQSIYSFRGANIENIMEFPKRYPDASIFKLTANYRSTPEVLKLANHSISHNKRRFPKDLKAIKGNGEKPNLVPLRDVFQQAEFVAQRVLELYEGGIPFREMAVLYRSHYQSMELQMELAKRGIPFEVRSGLRFFEQAHIKDVAAYLRVMVNPCDELAWIRVLRLVPRIGAVTAQRIWKVISGSSPIEAIFSQEVKRVLSRGADKPFGTFLNVMKSLSEPQLLSSPSKMIGVVLREGYEEYLYSRYPNALSRIEDLQQLSSYALKYPSVEAFLSDLVLLGTVMGEAEPFNTAEEDMLVLSSIHQAKGLEWRIVFIIWLVEGRFPSAKSSASGSEEEEERRLFYVACTRAKDEIYLCYPETYEGWEGLTLMRPSRFLREIPVESYEEWEIDEHM